MPADRCDVAIVGCGPVGVVLAALLARRGLTVVALDKDRELFPLPRAAHFDQEIMRVVQELGCAAEIAPSVVENPGMDFLTADHRVLLSMRAPGDTPSGWPASMMFHQPGFEQTLRDAAVSAGAELRLGTAVTSLDDLGDEVEVTLGDGGRLTAAFVVGCDGARSMVRKHLGVTVDDLGFEEPWLVLDLVLAAGVAPPSTLALQVCDPARPHTLVPMPAPRFRFEFMLLPGETAAELNTPARVHELLGSWLSPAEAELERSAVYTFHGLIATRWRVGRVLLAGDAAHQMPPFLGQGMCSGIRDAANLAWKLARVVQHGAPLELLDTYQAEREPHVRSIVEAAVGFGRIICTTDPVTAAERDAGMLAAREAGGGEVGGVNLAPLGPGPLVGAGGGTQAGQPVVGGTRLDDLVGPCFAVVARTAAGAGGWSSVPGVVVLDAAAQPELGALLDSAGAELLVVRPDRYVLTAAPGPADPGPALLALLGTGAG